MCRHSGKTRWARRVIRHLKLRVIAAGRLAGDDPRVPRASSSVCKAEWPRWFDFGHADFIEASLPGLKFMRCRCFSRGRRKPTALATLSTKRFSRGKSRARLLAVCKFGPLCHSVVNFEAFITSVERRRAG